MRTLIFRLILLAVVATTFAACQRRPIITAFTASPARVCLRGETLLSWNTANGDVLITPDVGRVGAVDSRRVPVNFPRITFEIVVSDGTNTATDTETVLAYDGPGSRLIAGDAVCSNGSAFPTYSETIPPTEFGALLRTVSLTNGGGTPVLIRSPGSIPLNPGQTAPFTMPVSGRWDVAVPSAGECRYSSTGEPVNLPPPVPVAITVSFRCEA